MINVLKKIIIIYKKAQTGKSHLSKRQSWKLIYFNNQALDQSYQHSSDLFYCWHHCAFLMLRLPPFTTSLCHAWGTKEYPSILVKPRADGVTVSSIHISLGCGGYIAWKLHYFLPYSRVCCKVR